MLSNDADGYTEVVRFNPNGTRDLSFGVNGVARLGSEKGFGNALTVSPTGKIYALTELASVTAS